jgi:histidyl-tRNA synthetase
MDRLPGFRDFYPEPLPQSEQWSAAARRHIFDRWRDTARRYGFQEYDGPPLEPLELYTVKSGAEIVSQLYNFRDKGDREVALRPEMTPTLARMVAAYERNYKKPIKWFAIPQLFRYERQQKGRLREHFQLNADIVGEAGPGADAELMALLIDTLRAVGLSADDFLVRLSSRQAWRDFFVRHGGQAADEYAFYQIIDKLEREPAHTSQQGLAALGFSLAEVRAFIAQGDPTAELKVILDNLGARGLGDYVKVDFGVIRGLAYYTGTVFEAFDRQGQFRAIAGGGRYDSLIQLVSGGKVNLPALGFGLGDVVLLELLKARGRLPELRPRAGIFFGMEDEPLRHDSLGWIQQLRDAGLAVDYALAPAKSDKQFKRALENNPLAIIRVQPEPLLARVRCLPSGEEKAFALPGQFEEMKQHLAQLHQIERSLRGDRLLEP